MNRTQLIAFLGLFISLYTQGQSIKNYKKNYDIEIDKVLNYFEGEQDPLKKKAALFLLKNLPNYGSWILKLKDASGNESLLNEFEFENWDEAEKYYNEQLSCNSELVQKRINDIAKITAEDLISTIDHSFRVWKNSPWGATYNFNTFCEYILPYRSNEEPFEKGWKQKYYNQYKRVIEGDRNAVDACSSLVRAMGKKLTFLFERPFPQPILSLDQIHFRAQGNCTDLANAVLMVGRSLGLAVTYDYTPYFVASSNSHSWNTIINKDGVPVPFNGTGALPYVFNPNYKKLGKVLRLTYSVQEESLARKIPHNDIPSSQLTNVNTIDVTQEYVQTAKVTYTFSSPLKKNIGYLAVFNKGKWRALWWGDSNGNKKVTFEKMGRDVVYLPSATRDTIVKKQKFAILQPEKYPLYINKKGEPHILKPNFKSVFNCSLSRINEDVGNEDGNHNSLTLEEGKKYHLYYWLDKWMLFGTQTVKNNQLDYQKLPENALFKLLPEKADDFERIFMLDHKNCKILWY